MITPMLKIDSVPLDLIVPDAEMRERMAKLNEGRTIAVAAFNASL